MPAVERPTRPVAPVVVVGAGPAGLTAAVALARQGVECLVLDQRSGPPSRPRATAVSLRSMEMLRSWGLEGEVRAGGDDVDLVLLECETLASAPHGRAIAVGYPDAAQSALISPTRPGCIPQDHLETVLQQHLRALPAAHLEQGAQVRAVTSGAEGARVTLASGRTIAASHVIAADGAHSAVRSSTGIAMRGPDHLFEGVRVELRAPLWDVVGPHRHGIYAVTRPDASCVVLPAGGGDRWLLGIEWDPTREHLADYTPGRLADFTARAAGVPTLAARIEHVGTFSFAAQIADRFRHGNVFLVGDAAHRITPRGGTGMNTAIADGFDLAWRLAWVHKGWADPALLDRYETERRPLVEHNLARSADADGSRRDPLTEAHVDLGGRLPHHWLPTSPGPRRSTLDLLGPGLTLFSGPDGSAWTRAATAIRTAVPISPVTADPVTARALGIVGEGALLVRPDGVPVASWSTPTAAPARLREAISGISEGRRPDRRAA